MKKGLTTAAALGLTAISVAGTPQERVSQTYRPTDPSQEIFVNLQDTKIDTAKTYQVSSTDLEKQKQSESDIIGVMDEINGNATRLLDFYGSEGLNKKFTQLMKEHPNFKDLSEEEQSTIIQEHFADFLDANPNFRMRMIFGAIVLAFAYALFRRYCFRADDRKVRGVFSL